MQSCSDIRWDFPSNTACYLPVIVRLTQLFRFVWVTMVLITIFLTVAAITLLCGRFALVAKYNCLSVTHCASLLQTLDPSRLSPLVFSKPCH